MTVNVASITPTPPSLVQLNEHGSSKTTWKTHGLVVTGYLLISIGLALVIASFYMSTIIHPLLALATPVGPIAAGSWLLNHADHPFPIPLLKANTAAPFKGIANHGNDCWINSTMQLLLHIPAFANRIRSARSGFRFFSHPLEKVFQAFSSYEKSEPIDSQILRDFLRETGVSSLDENTQDDPIRFILFFMEKMGYQLPTLYESTVDTKDGNITGQTETQTSPDNPIRFFDLGFLLDPSKPSVEKALKLYFNHTETLPSGTHRKTLRFMKRPPEDFGISIPQAAEDGMTLKREVDCPLNLDLPAAYLGEKASYLCDAFTYHSGKGANEGHWVAGIKHSGTWWHVSDSSVTEMTESEALNMMRKASFIHYSKA